ncbi:hypothetical protein ES703_44789 [subsurface metagenome]
MKKVRILVGLAVLIFWLCPTAPLASLASAEDSSKSGAQAKKYEDLKARLSVSEFKDKTAKGSISVDWLEKYGIPWKDIGEGMRDMLTTALFNTNRFIVLEREILDEVMKEQDLGASGRVKKGTEAPIGEIYGAELIITASITEFSGASKGLGGETEVIGIKIGGSLKKAHLGMDIRIIDAKTAQIVAATSIRGKASSFGLGGDTTIGDLPVTLDGFSNTPIEKAIRKCIQKAVKEIIKRTPKEYFKHK